MDSYTYEHAHIHIWYTLFIYFYMCIKFGVGIRKRYDMYNKPKIYRQVVSLIPISASESIHIFG